MIGKNEPFSPVVVIGLPRSGSTLATAILNQSSTHYVLNDAYFLQEIDKSQSWDGFATPDDAHALRAQLVNRIVLRSAVHSAQTIANSSPMPEQALENLLANLAGDRPATASWGEMMSSILGRAAEAAGKAAWGWNTPQDIYHIDRILEAFPNTRFIVVMRNPFDVLRSFHYRPNKTARNRYHPAAQARAWKKAIEIFEKKKRQFPDQIMLIRYEDIAKNTAGEIVRINDFIGADIPHNLDISELGSNSSFSANSNQDKQAGNNISKVEEWLADIFIGNARNRYGYTEPQKKFSSDGLLYLLSQSSAFLNYYGRTALTDKNVRKRIMRFLGKS